MVLNCRVMIYVVNWNILLRVFTTVNYALPISCFSCITKVVLPTLYCLSSGSCTLRTKELTDLVRTGVPIKYRSEIWMVFSGSLAEVS